MMIHYMQEWKWRWITERYSKRKRERNHSESNSERFLLHETYIVVVQPTAKDREDRHMAMMNTKEKSKTEEGI